MSALSNAIEKLTSVLGNKNNDPLKKSIDELGKVFTKVGNQLTAGNGPASSRGLVGKAFDSVLEGAGIRLAGGLFSEKKDKAHSASRSPIEIKLMQVQEQVQQAQAPAKKGKKIGFGADWKETENPYTAPDEGGGIATAIEKVKVKTKWGKDLQDWKMAANGGGLAGAVEKIKQGMPPGYSALPPGGIGGRDWGGGMEGPDNTEPGVGGVGGKVSAGYSAYKAVGGAGKAAGALGAVALALGDAMFESMNPYLRAKDQSANDIPSLIASRLQENSSFLQASQSGTLFNLRYMNRNRLDAGPQDANPIVGPDFNLDRALGGVS